MNKKKKKKKKKKRRSVKNSRMRIFSCRCLWRWGRTVGSSIENYSLSATSARHTRSQVKLMVGLSAKRIIMRGNYISYVHTRTDQHNRLKSTGLRILAIGIRERESELVISV